MFDNIKKYFESIRNIDAIKAQHYAKGSEDASTRFLGQQRSMTKKIEELTEQNIQIEQRIRNAADQRIERMETLHNSKCDSCRQNLEDERQRLLKRQNLIAKKIADFESVWMNMYQHATTIIDEYDTLLRTSGRLVASKSILLGFKKQVNEIIDEATPLLSVQMHDSSEDKALDSPQESIGYLSKK